MKDITSFHKSVMGHLHIAKNIECQDASASYQDDLCAIAVVADGHGAAACARSATGSAMAAQIALENLQSFAQNMATIWGIHTPQEEKTQDQIQELEKFTHEVSAQNQRLRTLTNSIIAQWHQQIHQDLEKNPLTPQDYQRVGSFAQTYQAGEKLPHLYGTTLIAALWLEPFLILLQQGDGSCHVFFQDDTIDRPIPPDDRCFENVTTSLCDADAGEALRIRVLNLEETPVLGCFLASDGVEDSYRDDQGAQLFFKELIAQGMGDHFATMEDYLGDYLPKFSEKGSGDDISVACLFRAQDFAPRLASYQSQGEIYQLTQQQKLVENKINSMSRKHGILCETQHESHEKMVEYREYDREYQEYRKLNWELGVKINKIHDPNYVPPPEPKPTPMPTPEPRRVPDASGQPGGQPHRNLPHQLPGNSHQMPGNSHQLPHQLPPDTAPEEDSTPNWVNIHQTYTTTTRGTVLKGNQMYHAPETGVCLEYHQYGSNPGQYPPAFPPEYPANPSANPASPVAEHLQAFPPEYPVNPSANPASPVAEHLPAFPPEYPANPASPVAEHLPAFPPEYPVNPSANPSANPASPVAEHLPAFPPEYPANPSVNPASPVAEHLQAFPPEYRANPASPVAEHLQEHPGANPTENSLEHLPQEPKEE